MSIEQRCVRWTATVLSRFVFATAGLLLSPATPADAQVDAAVPFEIAAGPLADALDQFGAQSGMQIVYAFSDVEWRTVDRISGVMTPLQALRLCLVDSGLMWEQVNANTVVVRGRSARAAPSRGEPDDSSESVTGLSDIVVVDDPRRTLPSAPSRAVFGFDKPLVETPRSVSIISAETIDLLGLSAVEDLVRVVPGVYTTTRWGIQGSIDIRNVPADTYFRGMKRLDLQGHGRSVLAAMETIEIVRGPPSPIYGMGKIGGYTNMIPKSVRAATGGYLLEPSGFAQGILGSYGKSEVSFGVGGPLPLSQKQAGYYVYGLFEDSNSYVEHVPVEQKLLQLAVTIDDFVGHFRLETGVNVQRSMTAGALLGRFTQALADDGMYIRGSPLVNLDGNANGRIGYLEMYQGSPVMGEVSAGNRALRQTWSWPTDADGLPLTVDRFPSVAGIPQSLYDYLSEHPEADPSGLLRAQGPGGPLPDSGYLPIGFALDPGTVGYAAFDWRQPGAFERELQADFGIAYFDLVYDSNPKFSIKNQLFFDSMDQYKLSEQPFSQVQQVYVIEDKLTATRHWLRTPRGVATQALMSVNFRRTSSKGLGGSGDYATHRTDAMSGTDLPGPNSTFATALLYPDVDDDGMPWTSHYDTQSWELGVGAVVDVEFPSGTNVVVGGRWDRSRARNIDFGGTLDLVQGTSAVPAVFRAADATARGTDSGTSWSLSLSQRFAGSLEPYVTVASTSLALDGNNNKYDNDVILAGHIGSSSLAEAGVKASLLGNRLYLSTAVYEQDRSGVSASDPAAVRNAHVSSTTTAGWEAELKWVRSRKLTLSLYALEQVTKYRPNAGAVIMVDARALGFEDVVDADGRVVYPAEAFLYGGRAYLALPAGMQAYEEKQGNPEKQIGVLAQYDLENGVGLTFSGNYFSSAYAGRLKLVRLPSAYVFNAGVVWNFKDWVIKCDLLNAFDETYFRARTGDTLGDSLVSVMPGRRWQTTFRLRF